MIRPRRTVSPSARELRQQTLPRRALTRSEAAMYVGVSARVFSRLVKAGRAPMPKVIATAPGSVLERWDLQQLDAFIDSLPSRGGASGAPARRLFSL
jgi:hypothetical protein